MNKKTAPLLALVALSGTWIHGAPGGTAFTYQGLLTEGGQPAQGLFDFRFCLFDGPVGGSALARPITNSALAVSNGVFVAELDFGPGAFAGQTGWLDIGVRTNGTPTFTTLSPRQRLSPVPYALYATEAGAALWATAANTAASAPATGLVGVLGLAQLPSTVLTNTADGVSLSGSFTGNGAGLTNIPWTALPAVPLTNGQAGVSLQGLTIVDNLSVTATALVSRLVVTNPPVLDGSQSTNLNASALASGTVPTDRLPAQVSLLGQSIEGTEITDGTLTDADIAANAAIADTKLATITTPGKVANSATTATAQNTPNAIVARDSAGNFAAGTITATFTGNGAGLTGLNASQLSSGTVADARLSANVALRNAPNTFTALTTFSPADGPPFAVGSTNKVTNLNADLVDGLDSTAFWRTTGNSGTAPGDHFVGTRDNQALELRVNATRALRLEPTGSNSVNVLAGYGGNWIKPGVVAATIAGGGAGNYAGTAYTNRIEADAGTISGGGGNSILAGSLYAAIGGGVLNTIQTTAQFAAITGGSLNLIGAGASGATIGGGVGNLIGTNAAYAIIPGGSSCTATGAYSFAAGRRAKALHPGAFVWADSQDADCLSLTNNHVRFRCQNGVRFSSGGTTANQNIFWNPGDAGWSVSSDRELKENFQPVDPLDVLDRVSRLPIHEWNFKGYPQRHLGPTAQDFHALFPFSTSDTTLNSGDLDGVALAAIQGLNRKLEARNAQLQTENQHLRQQLAELKAWVQSLADKLNGGMR